MFTPHRRGPARLALVRHGESVRNAVKQGCLAYPQTAEALALANVQDHDIPLSQRGRHQARVLGSRLRDEFGCFDRCYDSGYRRAQETRSLALSEAYTVEEIERMRIRSELLLRERESGLMRTMTESDLAANSLARAWRAEFEADPFQTRYLGGESVADVCDRVRQFILSSLDQHTDESVLIFCHDLVMKAFRVVIQGQDVAHAIGTVRCLEIPNCAVHVYSRVSNTWRISEVLPICPR